MQFPAVDEAVRNEANRYQNALRPDFELKNSIKAVPTGILVDGEKKACRIV